MSELYENLKKHLELPGSISECGIEENEFMDALPEMVKNALGDFTTGSNPRKPDALDVVKIYISAYYGIKDI